MRLFVCGDQTEEFIENTINDLDDKFEITSICGSASSSCMDYIVPWAEANGVPISLYLPEDISVPGMISLNTNIIRREKPYVVLIYKEDEEVAEHLMKEAYNDSSVQFVVKEVK